MKPRKKNTKLAQGYTLLGGNRCRCNRCDAELSANAFARFKHEQKVHEGSTITGRAEPNSGHIWEAPKKPNGPHNLKAGGFTNGLWRLEERDRAIELNKKRRQLENLERNGVREGSHLERIRDTLTARVEELREEFPDAEAELRARALPCRVDWNAPRSSNVRFAPQRWYPAGQMPPQFDPGPIPKFLQRRAKQ